MSYSSHIPPFLANLPSVVAVTGHYGVGKTNFSLNLAIDAARSGRAVTLVDLDIVNPYFRSSDYPRLLAESGVKLIAPEFAQTALDTPSLSGTIEGAIDQARNEPARLVVIDSGGDDVGATALARYSGAVSRGDYAMLYVVNAFREQTTQPEEAVDLLGEIEARARLSATALVNNSHLQGETTPAVIEDGRAFARAVSQALNLPIACTTLPSNAVDPVHSVESGTLACDSDYFVQVYVRTPWDAD